MAAVRQYVDAFNSGDEQAMAAACADPMQILDGMSPHVWQGPTAARDCGVTRVLRLSTLGLRAFTSVSVSHGTSMSPANMVRRCSRHVLVRPS
jgi:hypothetical protein